MPVFVVATLPDLRLPVHQRSYKSCFFIVISGVLLVHLAWIFLKLF